MKPILFNTDAVRAIQEGKKTVMRRAVKPIPAGDGSAPEPLITRPGYWNSFGDDFVYRQPYQPGDLLYVRETWAVHSCNDRLPPSIPCQKTAAGRDCYIYLADGASGQTPCGVWPSPHKWRPSIHMPREAARIILRVTDVRVERLQDIAEDDIAREGIQSKKPEWLKTEFADLWNSTVKPADHALYGWAANPWVWVIQFERISREETT